MLRHVSNNPAKIRALTEQAHLMIKRLNESKKYEYPSQTIKDYYDILHTFAVATAISHGVGFEEPAAHKQLIAWLGEQKIISEAQTAFFQSIREYRNKIYYEGLAMSVDFLRANETKILQLIIVLDKK